MACSECYCSKAGVAGAGAATTDKLKTYNKFCPYATYSLTTTAPGANAAWCSSNEAQSKVDNAQTKLYSTCTWGNRDSTSWLVGFSVRSGAPCVNPNAHTRAAATDDFTALLTGTYTGCDSFKTDPMAKALV